MTPSITKNKVFRNIIVILFWLAVWEIVSRIINQDIFLASPVKTVETFIGLLSKPDFWQTVLFSLIRIIAGFFSAVICAIFLAVLAASSDWIQAILHPVMLLIKSTPVASFIIIVLLWSGSQNLASIISFLMVLPVIYTNTLQGILNTDKKLLQMAQVFKIPLSKKVRLIYLHDVMPYFLSGLTVSLGLAWKSGIAAEVIGLPNGSIGERLYQAKIFLSSAELISWTITIILLSFLFERTVLYFVQQFQERIEA